MRKFDLWPLDLVENYIPVLHSLSPVWWQNFTWNTIILFRDIFFQNIKIRWFKPLNYQIQAPKWIWWSQWPHWLYQPWWPQQLQWPRQPHFIKIFTDPDGLIIPSTHMINTSPFLWNGSSKIQYFGFRLLRPADVNFLTTDWWNTKVQTSWSH